MKDISSIYIPSENVREELRKSMIHFIFRFKTTRKEIKENAISEIYKVRYSF